MLGAVNAIVTVVVRLRVKLLACQVQVMGARLGVDGQQPCLGFADVLESSRCRHVHKQNRGICHLCQTDGPVRCLRLGDLWPCHGVELRLRIPSRGQPFRNLVHHIMILGMDHCRHAELPGRHHDIEQVAVAESQRQIRHVQFDARDAVRHETRKVVVEDSVSRIRHNHMEAIVTVGIALGFGVVPLDTWLGTRLVTPLRGKCKDGRVAARNRRPRARFPRIARRRVVLFDMRMRVDSSVVPGLSAIALQNVHFNIWQRDDIPRRDVSSLGVDNFSVRPGIEIDSNHRNLAVLDADLESRRQYLRRRHDPAVAYDQVEHVRGEIDLHLERYRINA